MSEREPELGLGVVASVDRSRITVSFPATGEQRIYATGTPVLKRVQFRAGDSVNARDGSSLVVESVEDERGLLVYVGGDGRRVREDAISDVTSVGAPQERLLAGQVDPGEVFELRQRALQAQAKFRQSGVRGFLGGRLELIPHQYYILHEVAARQIPRVLLADEVGLGKTIEACLIVQRLLAVGKASRVLVLVPESLTHQWFVELLRRFNLWFSIYDEERCIAVEAGDAKANPFLAEQLALCSVAFLAGNPLRRDQAVEAGWDMVVVDEAHHLAWSPDAPSAEYEMVERLAQRSAGLLLLTATPTQLGLPGHFARLRLLDPDRYNDFDAFLHEAENFAAVAEIAAKILEEKPLKPRDRTKLTKIFDKDPKRLEELLDAVDVEKGASTPQHPSRLRRHSPRGEISEEIPSREGWREAPGCVVGGPSGARDALIRTLLDQHGTGRVMFRNTRASMHGFPKRKFCAAPIDGGGATLLTRIGREIEAEETGNEASVRYSFKEDPRIEWLVAFLKKHRTAKVLLICRSQRKVIAIEAALLEKMKAKVALFHEGLPLVQRDRNAAWFAEADGAQLLICSEIGSEGRNFQFAHHLVLFDLPLNPGLLEQRIGRLDRIGQTQTIQIHVPYLAGSAEECVVEWYHRGLESFEAPLHSGNEYQERFRERLLVLALSFGHERAKVGKKELDVLVAETAAFRRELTKKLHDGRDRLLEINSFNRNVAERVIARVRAADADPLVKEHLVELLDHFGVRIAEHEAGEMFLDPSHAYVEAFPSIPRDGMLATFDRRRAIAREDIVFLSQDHSLVRDSLDLLINSKTGTTAFSVLEADDPNLVLEAVFVLEAVAESRWHVDQFLAPTPVRIVVDLRGRDLTAERSADTPDADTQDGKIQCFLERPGFDATVLKAMLEGANDLAEAKSVAMKRDARARASGSLGADVQRLVDLRKLNDNVRIEEIELAQEQLRRTTDAIDQARLRLDSLRLILEGPADTFESE